MSEGRHHQHRFSPFSPWSRIHLQLGEAVSIALLSKRNTRSCSVKLYIFLGKQPVFLILLPILLVTSSKHFVLRSCTYFSNSALHLSLPAPQAKVNSPHSKILTPEDSINHFQQLLQSLGGNFQVFPQLFSFWFLMLFYLLSIAIVSLLFMKMFRGENVCFTLLFHSFTNSDLFSLPNNLLETGYSSYDTVEGQ